MLCKILGTYKITIPLVVLVTSYAYRNNLESFVKSFRYEQSHELKVFSKEELARYNGIIENELYIAVLGTVFDVTSGSKYYAKGAEYHYFVGKDGSRSLITGKFNDQSKNRDHILDLTCPDIFNLLNWNSTFTQKYPKMGVLRGRYYDKQGRETAYFQQLNLVMDKCVNAKISEREHKLKYPPCNIEWNVDQGTKVWCTKNSGGVLRSWTGVPRQHFLPGKDKPDCVCVDLDSKKISLAQFKEYENCSSTATVCYVNID